MEWGMEMEIVHLHLACRFQILQSFIFLFGFLSISQPFFKARSRAEYNRYVDQNDHSDGPQSLEQFAFPIGCIPNVVASNFPEFAVIISGAAASQLIPIHDLKSKTGVTHSIYQSNSS